MVSSRQICIVAPLIHFRHIMAIYKCVFFIFYIIYIFISYVIFQDPHGHYSANYSIPK